MKHQRETMRIGRSTTGLALVLNGRPNPGTDGRLLGRDASFTADANDLL
jgi:hypothetical protein